MDRAKQREIASKGGKAAHAKGTAHEFTPEEARAAGRKGGQAAHAKGTAHQFTPEEVEEVFAGDYKVRRTRQKLYLALGETLDGRLAFVVFRRLSGGMIRVITARDIDDSERRLFRRK